MAATELLARLLRRGGDDLNAALALARGEEVTAERRERLRRAGILRGGRRRRSLLPPALIAPLLALDRALANSRFRVVADLYALLRRSRSRSQRELILDALAEELEAERERLRSDEVVPSEELIALLEDLRSSLAELRSDEAEPRAVMRVSSLAAEVVELLAQRLTVRRRRRSQPQRRRAGVEELAAAAAGLGCFACPSPVYVPSTRALVSAAGAPETPRRTRPRRDEVLRSQRRRHDVVAQALAASDPLAALYGEVPALEAMARHAALAEGGRELLDACAVETARDRRAVGELEATGLRRVIGERAAA